MPKHGGGGKIPEVVEGTVKKLIKKADVRTPHGSTPGGPGTPGSGPRSYDEIRRIGQSKVPGSWGEGSPTSKGVGHKWADPDKPQADIVRIDQGNPNNSQVIQQGDHVQINSGGRVIGRDGAPIPGPVKQYPELAHIPLDEWERWPAWNRRT